MILPSVIDAIGDTPLVSLDRVVAELGLSGRILAKLDYLLPGFSKKDRAARTIIEAARASGELREGQPVVELTSGNMGTGLAIVCGVLGHPFIAVMSKGNSPERARMMRALGAEVVLVPQAKGSRRARFRAMIWPASKRPHNRSPATAPPFAPINSPAPATQRRIFTAPPRKSGRNPVKQSLFLPISRAPVARSQAAPPISRRAGCAATRSNLRGPRPSAAATAPPRPIRSRAAAMIWARSPI